MRVSLWSGLLPLIAYNQKRQQGRVRLFETGLRFIPDQDAENGIRQEPMIAGVISGNRHAEHWDSKDTSVDFFDAKADVEAILAQTASLASFRFERGEHSALHPGQTAVIYQGDKLVGYVGTIHPQFEKLLGTSGRVVAFELNLNAISQRTLPQAAEISKFPSNRRDIAIVVDESVAVGDILYTIEKFGGNQLVGLNLFDVYRGQGIEPGSKSLAISLTLQSNEKTLEEQQIQSIVNDIVAQLKQQFDASLRE